VPFSGHTSRVGPLQFGREEAATCQARYVPGRARNVRVNVRIESMSSEPVQEVTRGGHSSRASGGVVRITMSSPDGSESYVRPSSSSRFGPTL
jgi:hypothetical protein